MLKILFITDTDIYIYIYILNFLYVQVGKKMDERFTWAVRFDFFSSRTGEEVPNFAILVVIGSTSTVCFLPRREQGSDALIRCGYRSIFRFHEFYIHIVYNFS